jgi:hypothetical protein
MRKFLAVIFLFSLNVSYAQKPDSDALLKEGKKLYHLEKASWYSTDHFLETFKNKIDKIRGYLSYYGNDDRVYFIFFAQNQTGDIEILARYMFDTDPKSNYISLDTVSLKLLTIESEWISLRSSTLNIMNENTDDFFSFYENTSTNIIPVISGKKRKVYVLTASEQFGSLLLGNDYILTFTSNGRLKNKRKLHNSLIEIPYENPDKKIITATMHSHILSNHIEPTDICTLLLYKDYVKWNQHYVNHKDYISIFDLDKEILVIMTKENFEKMGKNSN